MRKIILQISVSLDGYIATVDQGLEWLTEVPNPQNIDYGYDAIYHSVDTVLMGSNTYHKIIELGGGWPYRDKKSYIVSRQNSNVRFIVDHIHDAISDLKAQLGKDIWLVGGGVLTTALLEQGLIDQMRLCVIPVILGGGVSLFPNKPQESQWLLIDSKVYDTGVLLNIYNKTQR